MNADEADKLAKAQKEVDNLVKARQDETLRQLVSAQLIYWSALLTVNVFLFTTLSVVLSVMGTFQGFAPAFWYYVRLLFPFFLVFNLCAILKILWCFKSERDHHRDSLDALLKLNKSCMETEISRILEQENKRISELKPRRIKNETFARRVIIWSISLVIILMIVMAYLAIIF